MFLCSACGTYFEKWNLFYHIREVHKKFICLFCLGIFPSAERLVNHLESKHIAKPSVFEHKDELMKSLRDHCYLMCCVCEYIFSEADDFTGHSCENYMKPCTMCGLKFIHKPNCKLGSSKPAAAVTAAAKPKPKKPATATEAKRRAAANAVPSIQPHQATVDLTSPVHPSPMPRADFGHIQPDFIAPSKSALPTPAFQRPAKQSQEKPNAKANDSSNDNDSSSDDNRSNSAMENNENRPVDVAGSKPNGVNRTVKPLRLSLVDHKNNIASKRNVSHAITPVHPGKNMNMMVNQEGTSEHGYRTVNGNDDSDQGQDDHGKQRLLIPHYVRDESAQPNEVGKEQTPLLVPKLKLKISREFQTSIESEESSTESDDEDDDDNDDSSMAEENTSTSLVEANSFVEPNPIVDNFQPVEPMEVPALEAPTEIHNSIESESAAPPASTECEQPPIVGDTSESTTNWPLPPTPMLQGNYYHFLKHLRI